MDLSLYSRVLARSWRVVLGGLVLAILLAVFATARPGIDGGVPALTYRKSEVWQSQTTVLLTQRGFPEGRTTFPSASARAPFADPGRFYSLADVYAQLVGGDEVKARIRRSSQIPGSVSAAALQSSAGNPTPLIGIFAKADSPEHATALAAQATRAFVGFIDDRQREAGIPPAQRVVVEKINSAESPLLIAPRSKTLPIMVFLAVISASIALAFVIENVKRREHLLPAAQDPSSVTSLDSKAHETADVRQVISRRKSGSTLKL
jgi:hypothetical protein